MKQHLSYMSISCQDLFSGSGYFLADIKFTGLEKNIEIKKQPSTAFLNKRKRPIRQIGMDTLFLKTPNSQFVKALLSNSQVTQIKLFNKQFVN